MSEKGWRNRRLLTKVLAKISLSLLDKFSASISLDSELLGNKCEVYGYSLPRYLLSAVFSILQLVTISTNQRSN